MLTNNKASQLFPHFLGFDSSLMVKITISGQVMTQKPWWRSPAPFSFHLQDWQSFTGIPCCHSWLCTFCYGSVHSNIYGCLLHCPSQCHYSTCTWTLLWMCWKVSQAVEHFHQGRCLGLDIIATPTYFQTLLLCHSAFWLTQWPLFFHHRIKAHQSSEKTLVSIKLISGAHSDASGTHADGKNGCAALDILGLWDVGWYNVVLYGRHQRGSKTTQLFKHCQQHWRGWQWQWWWSSFRWSNKLTVCCNSCSQISYAFEPWLMPYSNPNLHLSRTQLPTRSQETHSAHFTTKAPSCLSPVSFQPQPPRPTTAFSNWWLPSI